jgi:transposase-like protein
MACQHCRNEVYPAANTIFHKSATPLSLWFHATFLMASTRCGISAKQVERELGVTYKTAWRMCHLIRKQLNEGNSPLGGGSGHVEIDETYIGGKRTGKRGRGAEGKTAVVGMVERQGRVHAVAVPRVDKLTVLPLIRANVDKSATVNTDEFNVYNSLQKLGFVHQRVWHGNEEWARGATHTNTIEGFWSLFKRSVDGTHHSISPLYLQNYLSEYVFRWNHRNDRQPMFHSFLNRLALPLGGRPSTKPEKIHPALFPAGSFGRGAWEPLI